MTTEEMSLCHRIMKSQAEIGYWLAGEDRPANLDTARLTSLRGRGILTSARVGGVTRWKLTSLGVRTATAQVLAGIEKATENADAG